MSESSITVSQEVQAILAVQAANYQNSASVLEEDAAKFYLDVAAELRWILDDARKRAEAKPEEATPESQAPFPVGSKVRLTGEGWDGIYDGVPVAGNVVEITRIDGGLSLFEWDDSTEWSADGNKDDYWGGELVDPEIRVGDTVRIAVDYSVDSLNPKGTEFKVTGIQAAEYRHLFTSPSSVAGKTSNFYVTGDPAGRGVWEQFIEKVYE